MLQNMMRRYAAKHAVISCNRQNYSMTYVT